MTSDQKAQAMVDAFQPLTSVEPPVAQGGWQPISTAPKYTGKVILTIHKDDLYPVCAFNMSEPGLEDLWLRVTEGPEDVVILGKYEKLYRPPTHWMPLPGPPNP